MTATVNPPVPPFPDEREAVLTGPWLAIGRLAWLLFVVAVAFDFVALASRGTRMLLAESVVEDSYRLVAGLVTYPAYARFVLAVRYTGVGLFFATGLFIFWRRSNAVMGLIASVTVIVLPLFAGLGGQAPVYPEALASASLWTATGILEGVIYLTGMLATLLFIMLFPSGRFPHRWIRTAAWVSVGCLPITLLLLPLVPDWGQSILARVLLLPVLMLLLTSAISPVYRYVRVATPLERQQMLWVMASAAAIALWSMFVVGLDPFKGFDGRAGPFALFKLLGTVVVASLLPLSIARAILRYHLWDIDVIVRKTLVYSLLTGALLLIYFTSIIALQGLFTRVTGQTSTLATILSTLLIAALFLPLRGRIQDIIDRRFFRRKYDAERVLEGFAATCRDETDLDRLTAELVRVIQETMQPEHVTVWLLGDKGPPANVTRGDGPESALPPAQR